MHLFDSEGVRQEQRMILILDHDERVAGHDFVRDVPGSRGSARSPANLEAGTLAQRVEGETRMFAEDSAIGCLDRSGLGAKMLAQKLLERALADETNTGAIRLVEHWQAGRMRHGADLCFLQAAERKKCLGQGRDRDAMQEIALILGGIRRLQQFRIGT